MKTLREETEELVAEIRSRLGLGDGQSRVQISIEDAMPVLIQLAADIQCGQRVIGEILWHVDPTPSQLAKIAEQLQLKVQTLTSWITTYSRLRKETEIALLGFSMQQQLARVQSDEQRKELWESRPGNEWTLVTLTAAVDNHMDSIGSSVMPRTKKAGCKASFEQRQVKVNLELLRDSVIVKLAVSEGIELEDMRFEEISTGVYQVRFGW